MPLLIRQERVTISVFVYTQYWHWKDGRNWKNNIALCVHTMLMRDKMTVVLPMTHAY